MSGNRTRGVCVTGRNVTNYTNTDLFLFQNLKHWLRPLMFEFQRVRCCNRDKDSSFDHTMVDTPHPIRTAKLSTIGPNQYCGGGPRGNLGCRMFFFFCNNNRFKKKILWRIFFLGVVFYGQIHALQNAPPHSKEKKKRKNKPANQG